MKKRVITLVLMLCLSFSAMSTSAIGVRNQSDNIPNQGTLEINLPNEESVVPLSNIEIGKNIYKATFVRKSNGTYQQINGLNGLTRSQLGTVIEFAVTVMSWENDRIELSCHAQDLSGQPSIIGFSGNVDIKSCTVPVITLGTLSAYSPCSATSYHTKILGSVNTKGVTYVRVKTTGILISTIKDGKMSAYFDEVIDKSNY